jgi:hypothetical protein
MKLIEWLKRRLDNKCPACRQGYTVTSVSYGGVECRFWTGLVIELPESSHPPETPA